MNLMSLRVYFEQNEKNSKFMRFDLIIRVPIAYETIECNNYMYTEINSNLIMEFLGKTLGKEKQNSSLCVNLATSRIQEHSVCGVFKSKIF